MDVFFFMLCLLFVHFVHSLDVTISGQTYIEPGVPYNATCTVNEYRDNRKTSFIALIPGEQNEEIIVWYYKPYGCYKFQIPNSIDCGVAPCACDDNGLTTYWIFTSPSDLSTSVTFLCESTDNDNTRVTSTELAPTITEGPGTSLRFNPTKDTIIKELRQQLSVLCLAECTPVCQFRWEKDNSVVSPGATLQISNLSKEDNGTYTCTGYNGYGTPATKPLYLTVNYGPQAVTLLPPTTEYTVEEENTIDVINCTSDCRPSCKYLWSGPNVPSVTTNVLSLNNIQKNQTGVYNCTASNAAGSLVSSNINVNVQFGAGSSLQFEPSNTSLSTTKGDPLGPVNCVAICNPPCQYIWTKPDKTTINGNQLMLKSLSIEDHGQFTCTASNDIGSVNKSLDVIVNYGPQSITLLPNKMQYTATEGSNIAPINCTSNCRPMCKYTWAGPNVPAGTNNVLSLNNINAHQMGYFICLAYNDVGSLNSSAVNVNIQFGPGSSLKFKPNATSVTKIKGEKLGLIECKATCNPPCQYKWSNHDRTTNGGNLTVEHLSIEDHGLFVCTASNGFGDNQNKSLHVTVNYGPEAVILSPSTHKYTVKHGENVAPINCTAKCRPECKYTWFGPHVPSGIKNVLSLENIKTNQSGDFNCTATNVVGSMQSAIINIDVQYEPLVNRVTINGTNFTVSENTTVTLACNYEGNPVPKLTWKKNNIIIILGEDSEINGRSFYTINAVRCKDTGNYSCVANNSLGMSSAHHSMFVTCFPRLNEFIQQPPRRMRLSIGTTLNLTVGIIAYPKPLQVNWNFQPSTSSHDDRNNNYTTTLKSDLFTHVAYFYKYNLEIGDFGNYTLKIQNGIGGIVVHFYVDQAGLPDPPTDLLAVCGKSPIVVLWKPGFNGGSPQWFTVIWEDLKTNTSIIKSSIPDSDNGQYVKVTTSSLSDGATYIIHVEASNKYGRVKTTMHAFCTTKSAQFIQSENSTAVGVGAGIGTSLVILIFAAIVVFIVKRHRRHKNTEGNAVYEATQPGLRELSSKEDHIYNDLQQFQGDNTNKQRDQVAYANLSF